MRWFVLSKVYLFVTLLIDTMHTVGVSVALAFNRGALLELYSIFWFTIG